MGLTSVLAACSSIDVTVSQPPFEVIEEVSFDPSLGVDLAQMTRLESGVYVRDVEVGTGATLLEDSSARISFVGWLRNGLVFNQGQFSLTLGQQQVIRGLELGVVGMREGGVRLLVVPPELGYGGVVFNTVPPGSVLVIEVELIDVLEAQAS